MKIYYKALFLLLSFSIPAFSESNKPYALLESVNENEGTGISSSYLIRKGAGKKSIIQGLALDNKSRKIYALTTVGNPPMSTVNVFGYEAKKIIVANGFSLPSELLGHQGIAVEPGSPYLITSAGVKYDQYGLYIVRFKFSNNSLPSDIKAIRVFDDSFSEKSITSPAISSDGKYLVVYGRKNNENIIRVFNLNKTKLTTSKDISNENISQWKLPLNFIDKDYPLQALASDGKFVYILSGGANKLKKRIGIYTLDGSNVENYYDISLGKNESESIGEEGRWEPEGLTVDSERNEILIMFAMGDKGKRIVKLFRAKIDYN
ncbi:hypothetical protein ACCY16_20700 [Candidatus Pantoea formicae]|uniref:phage baseplate protein n=1 Tax=Candidatus Pantoea formicae TaxID=2608355 RepID=UPI003ED8A34C